MRRRLLTLAFGTAVLFGPTTAHALPITYNLGGTFGLIGASFRNVLSVGDPWSLSLTTDPTALLQSTPTGANYAATGSGTFGPFTGTMTGVISIIANPVSSPGSSTFIFNTIQGIISPTIPIPQLTIVIEGFPPFMSTALPTSVANFAGPTNMQFGAFANPALITGGTVTSMTVTTMPTPVPEPTSALLLGTGLVAMGFLGSAILFGPSTAQALPITYTFSGVFTSVGPTYSSVLSVGSPWSLSISADPTAIAFSDPTFATYFAGGSWTLGSFSGTVTGGLLSVSTNPSLPLSFGTFSPATGTAIFSPPTIGAAPIQALTVWMIGALFPSTALPTSLNLANFGGPNFFELGLNANPRTVTGGPVNSITVTTLPTPIPEPTSALLLGTGLVAMGIRRFRHKR